MIPELRERFNQQWTPELYAEFLRRLEEVSGTHVAFRCSETPVFFPRPLLDKMVALRTGAVSPAGNESGISHGIRRCDSSPVSSAQRAGRIRYSSRPISVWCAKPMAHSSPNWSKFRASLPSTPFKPVLAKEYQRVYRLNENLYHDLPRWTGRTELCELLRRAILNGHAPEQVVLLEIEPYRAEDACPISWSPENCLAYKLAA